MKNPVPMQVVDWLLACCFAALSHRTPRFGDGIDTPAASQRDAAQPCVIDSGWGPSLTIVRLVPFETPLRDAAVGMARGCLTESGSFFTAKPRRHQSVSRWLETRRSCKCLSVSVANSLGKPSLSRTRNAESLTLAEPAATTPHESCRLAPGHPASQPDQSLCRLC